MKYFNHVQIFIKRNKMIILFLFIGILYLLFSYYGYISIPCPIHFFFHIWCPGCGVTRMIYSMIHLDFYQAFRYNSILFVSFPLFAFFLINAMYCNYKGKVPLCYKVPRWIYYSYIFLLFLFMILRNVFGLFTPIGI